MTSRDLEIIDFLQKFKYANTTMLQALFFPSRDSCYKTLSRLYKAGKIKRTRMIVNSINCEYVYYLKNVSPQMKHALTVTWFFYKWSSMYNVTFFEKEYKLGDIIPDAVFIYEDKGVRKVGILEAELSNKGFNYLKYERFFISGEYKKYFNVMPDIYVLGKASIPTGTRCKYKIFEIDIFFK